MAFLREASHVTQTITVGTPMIMYSTAVTDIKDHRPVKGIPEFKVHKGGALPENLFRTNDIPMPF